MADKQGRTNLSRLSRLMARLSAIGAVAVPLLVAATFFIGDVTGRRYGFGLSFNGMDAAKIGETPFDFRFAAFVFAIMPTGFTVWALLSLRRLFLLYAAGEVFSHQALRTLNHVAVALFASVIVGFAIQPPVTLLLSWYRGAGHRSLSLGIRSEDVITLFLAGAVLVIARVMAEARRMADENASFV